MQTRVKSMRPNLYTLFLLSLFSASPSLAQSNCAAIPALKIWDGMTNLRVERYVETEHDGNWQPYLNHLAQQLEKIQSIQVAGKSARINFKDKFIQLSGDQLDAFITASTLRYEVVQCLSYGGDLMAEAANLESFETAAGGNTDEAGEVEIPISSKPTSSAASAVEINIATSCKDYSSTFAITNQGETWPKSAMFYIYRMSEGTKQVIISRRMRLKANQSSKFRIKASKNPTGQLGLFVDPSWYVRDFKYDATVRCR